MSGANYLLSSGLGSYGDNVSYLITFGLGFFEEVSLTGGVSINVQDRKSAVAVPDRNSFIPCQDRSSYIRVPELESIPVNTDANLEKAPAENLPYSWDFTRRSILDTETITGTPTISGSPAGLTIGTIVVSGKKVVANISGGASGTTYVVTCTANTSNGHVMVSIINLTVNVPPTPNTTS